MKKILMLAFLCTASVVLYAQENKNIITKNKGQIKSLPGKKQPTKISTLSEAKVLFQESKIDSSGRDLKIKAEIDNKIRKNIEAAGRVPSGQAGNTIKVVYSNSKD